MSSRSYILQIMLWHQSLKSIHHRTLLIFQNKKTTDLRVKTWGDKRHVIPPPPHVKTWGGYITPIPPGFTPLVIMFNDYSSTYMFCFIDCNHGCQQGGGGQA